MNYIRIILTIFIIISYIDIDNIGSFVSIDYAYKLLEDNSLFCIKCKENKACTGKCNLSYGASEVHYCSPALSIPINSIKDENYNNPMNKIFEIYFSTKKRKCDDIRCKNGIIMHNTTIFYNNFEYQYFLIFIIDTNDVNPLQRNYIRFKQLFNHLLILDSSEYYITAYYLMPCENYFVVLFKSGYTDEFIQKDKWYLFDHLQKVIFEII